MQLANQEAQSFKHEYIGTEHILLGLILEGSGVAVHVLTELGIDLGTIQLEVERLISGGPNVIELKGLPQTPRAKKVILYAIQEARELGHNYVGTEHVLLGLLREDEGVGGVVLSISGLSVERARSQVIALLSPIREEFKAGRSFLPAREPKLAPLQKTQSLPARCPKCGANQIVRLVWPKVLPRGQTREDIKQAKAIIVSVEPPGVEQRSWACLKCAPQLSEVHELSLKDYQLQLAKEEEVTAKDFEAAATCRDQQVPIRKRISAVLIALLGSQ